MILTRRKLIAGLGLLVAAPYVVKASSLMPIKVWRELELVTPRGRWKADISDGIFLGMATTMASVHRSDLDGAYWSMTREVRHAFDVEIVRSQNVLTTHMNNPSMEPLRMFRAVSIRTQGEA